MRLFLLILFFCPVLVFSQSRLSITAFGGVSNYHGDLQPKRISFAQSNFAGGLGLQYELSPRLALRGELRIGHVEAHDSLNPPTLRSRNLHFRSRIYEASGLIQYSFGDIMEKPLVPYVFAGLAIYHFSPYTYAPNGKKVFLQPLSTEGQGLPQYPNRKKYSLDQLAIPFGFGARYAVNEKITLGFEIGLRKLFTDYLDDVSTTYVDDLILLAEKGQRAVDYSYRGDELKDGLPNYPPAGWIRGGKHKDWYYFTGIHVTYRIFNIGYRNASFGGGSFNRKQMDCPKF